MQKVNIESIIVIILVIIIIIGIIYSSKSKLDNSLVDQVNNNSIDCNQYLDGFQQRMTKEYTNYGAQNVNQFVIAYSKSLNTCISGFVVTLISNDPGLFGKEYQFHIYDVITNSPIGSFTTLDEKLNGKHQYINNIEETKNESAQQYAWSDYDEKLRGLTDNKLKIFNN